MEPLYCSPEDLLPGVELDRESQKFRIFGTSCPFDAFDFFNPIFAWIDEYVANPLRNTVLDIDLYYFNTVSAKFLLMIMDKLEKLTDIGYNVKIRWYYDEEDDDMKEEGEEFESISNINFELIPVCDDTEKSKDDAYFQTILNETN